MRVKMFHWASALIFSFLIHAAGLYYFIKVPDDDGAKAQGSGGFEVALSLQTAIMGSDHSADGNEVQEGETENDVEEVEVENSDVAEVQPELEPEIEPEAEFDVEVEDQIPAEMEVETAQGVVPKLTVETEPEPVISEVVETPKLVEPKPREIIENKPVLPVVEPVETVEIAEAPVPRPKLKPAKVKVIETPKALAKPTAEPKPKEKANKPLKPVQAANTSPVTAQPKQTMPAAQASQGRAVAGAVADRSDTENSVGGGQIVGTASPTYVTRIREWLERHKTYPKKAKRRRHQGTVLLSFSINRDGKVLAYEIEKASGIESLDKATIQMLLSAAPLPKFPDDMKGDLLEFVIPVSFSLSN